MAKGSGPGPSGGMRPVDGKISSPFGTRKDPVTGKQTVHKGVDFKAPLGTPVKAMGAGTITKLTGWQDNKDHSKGYGQRVTIDHGNGNVSIYGHLSVIDVKPGDNVAKGQVIGHSGNSGKSTAPHVHYEEKHKGEAHPPTFDPAGYKPH